MPTITEPEQAAIHVCLAGHIRACAINEQVVLLDLMASRYLALHGRPAQIVATAAASAAMTTFTDHADRELAGRLVRKGLLATAPRAPAQPPMQLKPAPLFRAMNDDTAHLSPQLADGFRFIAALAQATFWLKYRSLDSIVHSVQRNRARRRPSACDQRPQLIRAARAFDHLRPFGFSSKDRCLLDSLALTLFLARQELHAQWVVGVALHPFRAHSWVQLDGEALNDNAEHVRQFKPILAV